MILKQVTILASVLLIPVLGLADNASDAEAQLKKHPTYQHGYLSKEASLSSFELPEGYKLELVLSSERGIRHSTRFPVEKRGELLVRHSQPGTIVEVIQV